MEPIRNNKIIARYCLSLTLVGLVSSNATAAESQPDTYMEEVVVTAQKRTEKLQDVAISVTAFTGENIEKLGLRQSQEPNLVRPAPVGDPTGKSHRVTTH